MPWYAKYLSVFEKPLSSVLNHVLAEVKDKLERFKCDDPIASVVVIAHNEETRLLSCLWSLSNNVCNYPIEIIGVNNSSTDRTSEIFDRTGVRWFMEEKKSCGYARRCGLFHTKGKYYICIDADTIYPPYYIQTFIDELEKPGVVAVSSLWSYIPDGKSSKLGMKIYESLRDMHVKALSRKSPEWSVRGMVFAYVAEYGREIGYNVHIKRGEDGSMALGLKKYGKIKLITSRKTRVATCMNTFNKKGSLGDNFRIELIKGIKHLKRYFFRKKVYKDRDDNLISLPQETSKI